MNHKIFVGDCREALKSLPSSSVHLIVTSPPYNVGIEYGTWNDSIAFEQYAEFTKTWLTECFRVLVDGGRICVNVPTASYKESAIDVFRLYAIMRIPGFQHREFILWVKRRKSDNNFVTRQEIYGTWNPVNPMLRNPTEAILVMNKNSERLYGETQSDLTQKEFLQWNYTVWEMDTEADRSHPAPYPIELPKRLIKLFSFPEQVVLDPFLGSGTTMKACMELNRKCIGIELNPDYVRLMKEKPGLNLVEIREVPGVSKEPELKNSHPPVNEMRNTKIAIPYPISTMRIP